VILQCSIQSQGTNTKKNIYLLERINIINIQTLQRFMFDCVIKFLLDAKLIDSKNYDNSEVFFFVSVVTKLFIIHSVSYKMHHPLKIKLRD
jgi:hypothetical protein